MKSSAFVLLVLVGCGTDTGGTGPNAGTQSRLARVGTAGALTFDETGAPMQIVSPGATYSLAWEAGELRGAVVAAADRRVEARLVTVDGFVTEMIAGDRHDHLSYGADGRLASWDRAGVRREYRYDAEGRVIALGDTTLTYNADGCPQLATTAGKTMQYVYSDYGQLDGIADDAGVTGIDYDHDGRISKFESSAQALEYVDGEASGLDLWPGHYFGGAASGFPEHGELFHLDGRCDPSLTSQDTIRAMVIGSL